MTLLLPLPDPLPFPCWSEERRIADVPDSLLQMWKNPPLPSSLRTDPGTPGAGVQKPQPGRSRISQAGAGVREVRMP